LSHWRLSGESVAALTVTGDSGGDSLATHWRVNSVASNSFFCIPLFSSTALPLTSAARGWGARDVEVTMLVERWSGDELHPLPHSPCSSLGDR
jgi:hypothetical protein